MKDPLAKLWSDIMGAPDPADMDQAKITAEALAYDKWLRAVDRKVFALTGTLPDDYPPTVTTGILARQYQAGVSPEDAAECVIHEIVGPRRKK